MTVSLIAIMFELTGALSLVLPLMITVMAAKWTADVFGKASIYERLIDFNGYPFLEQNDDYVGNELISEIATNALVTLNTTGMTVEGFFAEFYMTVFASRHKNSNGVFRGARVSGGAQQ